MAGSQMTGEEAAAALKAGVEALFAEARVGEPAAYALSGGVRYVYVAFWCGRKHPEGGGLDPKDCDMSIEELVSSTLRAVRAAFPEHQSMGCLWRMAPHYEWLAAAPPDADFGHEGWPAHHSLYCRLVAVPLGAKIERPS